MPATTQATQHCSTFSPSVARFPFRASIRPTSCPLPPAQSPRRMHELQSDGPTSPYANMSIPFFDRGESNALGEIASREYRSLSETVSTDGLVARLRENDKAALHKLKGGKPVQADSQPQKT